MGDVKKLGEGPDVSMDDVLRSLLGQMCANDNDTSYLSCRLKAADGTEADLEFEVRIGSINGVKIREEDEDE